MKRFLPLVLVIAVAVLLVSSLFKPGFMDSHDSLWHVERFMNMKEMLLAGQFPVRWSANLDDGYGLPLFNFTYPLPYYLGGSLMLVGLGPVKVYNLLLLIIYLTGGIGFYFLGRGGFRGVGAALIYFLSPYVFLDIFVRGALGEIFALSFFPFVMLALKEIDKKGQLSWYSSIPLAFLLLSHNFYGLLLSALAIFLIIFTFKNKKASLLSVLLSFGLAAFFVLPSLLEKKYLAEPVSGFNYEQHFVYPVQLLYSKWSYLGSFPGLDPSEMSFQLGLSNWLIFALSLLIALIFRKRGSQIVWYLIPLTVSLFLTLPLSKIVWQAIPLLQTIQFPWRFIGIATIIMPFLYLELVSLKWGNKQVKLLPILTVFLLVLGFYNVRNYRRPVEWLDQQQFLTQHYLYKDRTTTAHRDELVPRWAAAERFIGAPGIVIGKAAEIKDIQARPLKITFTATAENQEAFATVYRNYYPAWVAEADGDRIDLKPNSTGEIIVPLAVGRHAYTLFITETPLERLSDFVTLISLAGIIYLWRRNG